MVSPAEPVADRADLGDAAVPDANIGKPLAGLIDDGSAFEHKIEGLGQVRLLLRGLPRSHKCRKALVAEGPDMGHCHASALAVPRRPEGRAAPTRANFCKG